MAGQTDRFGQPIPAAPGYQTILNPDGSQPQMRNILYLGDGLTCVDEPNSEASRLNIDISVAGAVQQVDAVTNLRNDLFLLGPSVDKIYVTKNYYTSTDTGGMSYRWNASDTTIDDGVLHIKNSHHSTGRFQPVKPSDGMMDAQAAGPALADIGSITRSFDPTGTMSIGAELKRVSTILRNSGWNGLRFGKDYAGNGRYKISGTEEIGVSASPDVSFLIEGVAGAVMFGDPSGLSFSRPIGVYAYTGNVTIVGTPFYTAQNWFQTINGGENVFAAVADITGLAVGDTVIVRIGAEATDASGLCASYFYTTIKAITPGSGTTGTVETWGSCPEPTPATAGINTHRTQNHHDMVKVTGFQDYTTVRGLIFENVFFAFQYYRNCTIDCVWTEAVTFVLDGLGGIGLEVPRLYVSRLSGSVEVPGDMITLASQYDTHIGTLIVNDVRPFNNTVLHILTEESSCRNTRVDTADVTYNAANAYGGAVIFAGQTPGQTDQIVIGNLTVRGGYQGFDIGSQCYVDVLDDKCGSAHYIYVRPDQVKSIIYFGQMYRNELSHDYSLPIPTSATTKTINFPIHGLTSGLRVKATSTTGITSVTVSGNGSTQIDVTSAVVSGVWSDLNQAAVMSIAGANFYGTTLSMTVTTDGTTPAGNSLYCRHSVLEQDLIFTGAGVDTSVPYQTITNGAPTANANFIGQDCFDSTNSVWYKSVATGTGASDWKPLGSGSLASPTTALGNINLTKIATPTVPSGKIALWADSTSGAITGKDQFGVVSVQPIVVAAVAHQWFSALSSAGVLVQSQPSSLDLSDLAPVALTNADATIAVGGGSYYSLAASTLTGLHTLTLGNTGATDKQAIQVRVFSQGSNYLINDSAAALLLSVASGTKVVATFVWATGTGKFQLQSWNFFT